MRLPIYRPHRVLLLVAELDGMVTFDIRHVQHHWLVIANIARHL